MTQRESRNIPMFRHIVALFDNHKDATGMWESLGDGRKA